MKSVELPSIVRVSTYWTSNPCYEPAGEEESDLKCRHDPRFTELEHVANDEVQSNLKKEFFKEVIKARNSEIWENCLAAGADVQQVHIEVGGNIDNLRRTLKNGTCSEGLMWHVAGMSRLEHLVTRPTMVHHLKALAKVVQRCEHRYQTLELRTADASRKAIDLIPLPSVALLLSLMNDEDTLVRWLSLAFPLRYGFDSAEARLKAFVTQIYDQGRKFVSEDERLEKFLREISPTHVESFSVSLAHLAEAWNPNQVFFHVALDSIRVPLKILVFNKQPSICSSLALFCRFLGRWSFVTEVCYAGTRIV